MRRLSACAQQPLPWDHPRLTRVRVVATDEDEAHVVVDGDSDDDGAGNGGQRATAYTCFFPSTLLR